MAVQGFQRGCSESLEGRRNQAPYDALSINLTLLIALVAQDVLPKRFFNRRIDRDQTT